MTDYKPECPINGDNHKYFIFSVRDVFESFNGGDPKTGLQLFVKVEYAVLGCNCGSVLKRKVKQA